jgi:transcriptional regulator with XRE-family HTH domain
MSKPLPPGKWRLVNLRPLRVQQRLTLRELAAKAGVTAATVSRLELLREAAYPITAQAIADALGVQVSDLLGEEEQEPPGTDPLPDAEEAATPAA